MVNVLDDTLQLEAVIEKATGITETEALNGIGSLEFSMPYNDAKRKHIRPFGYIELTDEQGKRENLYRILPYARAAAAEGGFITVACEHVLATLLDDALPGWHQYGGTGLYTDDAIRYVLSHQTTPNWVLGDCEFMAEYLYGWQHEKCLTALHGISATFSDYKWECDVSSYPWVLHLRRIDISQEPTFRIAYGYNRTGIVKTEDPTNLVTRMYAFGYGEGINQLDFADINDGKPYLDALTIEQYGIKCGYNINRAIEDAETLMAETQALLDVSSKPKITYTVTAMDLFEYSRNELDRPRAGKITKVFDEDFGEEFTTYVTGVTRSIGGENGVEITLSNMPEDVADQIAELANRQRIERSYAQGAAQIYMVSLQGNATNGKPLRLNFFAPEELRIINDVRAKITLGPFRAYSQATASGGGGATTSESGGGGSTTSAAGGSSTPTTSTDSQKSATSSSGGSVNTTSGATSLGSPTTGYNAAANTGGATVNTLGVSHTHTSPTHYHSIPLGNHSHGISIGSHTHSITIPSHAHTVTVPSHAHNVSLPTHSHSVSLPSHTHGITAGIYESGNPASATVKTMGKTIGTIGRDGEIDLTPHLLTASGDVPRNSWLYLDIDPDSNAYITVALFFQGFIQSRGGGRY